MNITSLLSTENFIAVNKQLIKEIGLLEAVLFCELCAEHDYYEKEKQLQPDGYFYSTIDNIEQRLRITKKQQLRIITNLQKLQLISIKYKDIPRKRYIKIEQENLLKQLSLLGSSSGAKREPLVGAKGNIKNNIIRITNKEYKEKKFIKPTVEEISAYCKENNYDIDAEYFYDFHEQKGWKITKANTPMKDWKATIRTWVRNQKAKEKTNGDSDEWNFR